MLKHLEKAREQHSRKYLCKSCWRLGWYKMMEKHKATVPSHKEQVVSFTYYASEAKLVELAGAGNRLIQKGGSTWV